MTSYPPLRPWICLVAVLAATAGAGACSAWDETDDGTGEPSQTAPAGDSAEVLSLVNQARAAGRTCGSEGTFAPASALGWNDRLGRAAQAQANDMASHNFIGHTGSDGSSVDQRVQREGYDWSAVGENVAAGQSSPAEAMNSWLASPGHCANIMNPAFVHMGTGRAQGGSYGVYWAQVFARPR